MRTTLLLIFFAFTLCLKAQTWPPEDIEGDGTENNPWQITTAEHLKALSDYVRTDDNATLETYYKLMNDIDLSIYENWQPIGCCDYNFSIDEWIYFRFKGNFDGNGKTVKNITNRIAGYSSECTYHHNYAFCAGNKFLVAKPIP